MITNISQICIIISWSTRLTMSAHTIPRHTIPRHCSII